MDNPLKIFQLSRLFLVLSLLTLFILVSCRQNKETNTSQLQMNIILDSVSVFTPDLSKEDLLKIYELQNNVVKNPTDILMRKEFIENSYFRESNTLVTFGAARLKDDNGREIFRSQVKRAVRLDANRWAAYGVSWIKNNYQPDFGLLKSSYLGNSKELISFTNGDSLIIGFSNEVLE
jgi:hypothetical protein